MNLIQLIAKNPKQVDTIENMIEAIKLLATNENDAENEKQELKIKISTLKYFMTGQGEKLAEHEFEEIMLDCKDIIVGGNLIIIEDLA